MSFSAPENGDKGPGREWPQTQRTYWKRCLLILGFRVCLNMLIELRFFGEAGGYSQCADLS